MLKLKVKHSSGMRKIYDRKPKQDEQGNPIEGEFVEVIHRLGVDAVKITQEPMLDGDGNPIMDERFNPPKAKMKEIIEGKPFEVNDEEYVLSRHGAILERA